MGRSHKQKRKKTVIAGVTLIITLLSINSVAAVSLEDWYQNNADILENNSVGGMAVRYISWGITKILVLFANACEGLYDTAFGFIDFTASETINKWIVTFKPAMIALMAASLLWLGILLIMQHDKKPKVVTNIAICILCVCCSTLVFAELNGLANTFKEGVQKNVTASKLSYSTINNNIVDLVYLNDKKDGLENVNWSNKKERVFGAGIKDEKTFNNIDYLEVLNYSSDQYNYKGDTSDILRNRLLVVPVDGKLTYSVRENYNGFGWNSSDDTDLLNEFYYRYQFDSLTAWLQLIAIIIIYLTMSYKCIRIAYELLVARLLAYLYSAELSGGEKIKKILVFIRDSYILLCVTVLCLKLYDMMNAIISKETEGLIKGLFALFLAFCIIDGPNLVEKLLGMDAGLKSSTARMMAIGRAGMGIARAPKNIAKAAAGAASGSMAKGGLAGAAVGAVAGKKQADGSRTGGLMNMMDNKGDKKAPGGAKDSTGGANSAYSSQQASNDNMDTGSSFNDSFNNNRDDNNVSSPSFMDDQDNRKSRSRSARSMQRNLEVMNEEKQKEKKRGVTTNGKKHNDRGNRK